MAKFSTQFLQGLLQPSYQQGMLTAAQQLGARPRQIAQQRMMAGIDPNTPQGLSQLAKFYQSQGDMTNAVKYATASRTLATQEAEKKAFSDRKTKLAKTAEDLGLTELSGRIPTITDPDELSAISSELYKRQMDKLPTQSILVRKQRAANHGISEEEFTRLKLSTVTDDAFNSVISGQKGDLEVYLTADNQVKPVRVNESGMVYDDKTKKWVQPSDLGLERAPAQVQRVEQVASTMGTELAKLGAKRFAEAAEKAQASADSIRTIDQTFGTVDNMFTGFGAEFRKDVARFANVFGIELADPEVVTNTETYIARSATRVADYITNLGAGTGLSDADREFARQVVGGSEALNAATLKRLLGMLREDAVLRIENYNSLRDDVSAELGTSSKGAMSFYPPVAIPVDVIRSQSASTYLSQTQTP